MFSFFFSRFSVATLSLFVVSATALAQDAPDYVFMHVTSDPTWYTFGAYTLMTGSYVDDESGSTGPIDFVKQVTGSPSNNSVTLGTNATVSGSNLTAAASYSANINQGIYAYSRFTGTVIVSANTTTSQSIDAYAHGGFTSTYENLPFDSNTSDRYFSLRVDATTDRQQVSITDGYSGAPTRVVNLGCSASASHFTAYPGVDYYVIDLNPTAVSNWTVGGLASGGGHIGDTFTVTTSGTTTFTFARGAEYPLAQIDGPYVSNALTPNPSVGQSVTLKDLSYDPDDALGTAGSGICARNWTITRPGGQTPLSSTSSQYSFTANVPGQWTAHLAITDDEGMTSETDLTFYVGKFEPVAGACKSNEPCEQLSCGANSGSRNLLKYALLISLVCLG